MGALGGLLGFNGGAGGTGFAAPQAANIVTPTTADQATQSYSQNQQALQQQQALLNQVQAQNGLGNQSQIYNQLQGVANGTGPNLAQAMLNQATGQNVANQAALMAGQRGASANAGLIARQAAQQGADLQQQAVGQGATMQANQALNAINSAGNIANTQASNQIGATGAVTGAQQAEQGQLLNAIQGQNNANVSMQGNINDANAGLAKTNMQGTQSIIGGLMGGAGAALSKAHGGEVPAYSLGGPIERTHEPTSFVGKHLKSAYAKGGKVPAIVSPGERYLPPNDVKEVLMGHKQAYKAGELIPGRALIKGDSLKNDIVPKTLQAGGVVIPRSIMNSKDPAKAAAKFVAAHAAMMKKKVVK